MKFFFPHYWGGQKLHEGGGLCFGGSAYGNPPLPSPLAHLCVLYTLTCTRMRRPKDVFAQRQKEEAWDMGIPGVGGYSATWIISHSGFLTPPCCPPPPLRRRRRRRRRRATDILALLLGRQRRPPRVLEWGLFLLALSHLATFIRYQF